MKIGSKVLHVWSTRTTDLREAKKQAEEFWGDCLLRKRQCDGSLPTPSGLAVEAHYRFDQVGDEWLKRKKAEAGSDQRKQRAYRDAKNLYLAENGLAAFFKRIDVGAITTDRIRAYLVFAADHSKKGCLAPTTQRNHLAILNSILKFAHEKRMIGSVPQLPKVRLKDNPRSWFKPNEYRLLHKRAGLFRRHARLAGDDKAAARWQELEDFIIFMVNTFLRPSEWKELRQRHVTVHRGEHTYLEIAVPNGKTRMRNVISMPTAVSVYERILKRDGVDPERFLFKNQYWNRTTAYERMRDSFEELLEKTGLGPDEFGQKRVMYSLRHTSLMLRLLNGDNVDLLLLARNAGTSIDQLERFYLSHIEPAMKVENLQSFKPVKKRPVPSNPPRPKGKVIFCLDEPTIEPSIRFSR